jgi:hypothetical protein
MRERYFQDEWIRSWRHYLPDSHIIKIPDSLRGADARFSAVKPYDFYAVVAGRVYAMELKLMTRLGGLPFNSVTEGQMLNLEEAVRAGGTGWIVVNYRVGSISPKQQKNADLPSGTTLINRVYIFDAWLFRDLDKGITDKSLPHKEIVKLVSAGAIITVDRAGEFWDIKNLFEKEII